MHHASWNFWTIWDSYKLSYIMLYTPHTSYIMHHAQCIYMMSWHITSWCMWSWDMIYLKWHWHMTSWHIWQHDLWYHDICCQEIWHHDISWHNISYHDIFIRSCHITSMIWYIIWYIYDIWNEKWYDMILMMLKLWFISHPRSNLPNPSKTMGTSKM